VAEHPITGLPGLGPRSQIMLECAGITRVDQLRALGAAGAYVLVKRTCAGAADTPRPSLNLLWALEAALTGLPWQEVARQHRTSLLLAVEEIERMA
jgi:DNA transformation protein